MIEVLVSSDVDVSSDALWAIVADFGNVAWMQGITRSEVEGEGPGMVRFIFAGDAPPVHEELEFVDDAKRRLGYTIPKNLPMPVTNYHSVMTVHDRGPGKSRLEWSCQAEPEGVTEDEARAVVEAMYNVLSSWVKGHAEG